MSKENFERICNDIISKIDDVREDFITESEISFPDVTSMRGLLKYQEYLFDELFKFIPEVYPDKLEEYKILEEDVLSFMKNILESVEEEVRL